METRSTIYCVHKHCHYSGTCKKKRNIEHEQKKKYSQLTWSNCSLRTKRNQTRTAQSTNNDKMIRFESNHTCRIDRSTFTNAQHALVCCDFLIAHFFSISVKCVYIYHISIVMCGAGEQKKFSTKLIHIKFKWRRASASLQ